MPVTADKPAPYATSSGILDLIERYRSRGLPSPISHDVLGRAGISDSLIPRTIQALQTLDLIDEDGKPTKTLEGLRLAPEAEFKQRMAEWLKSAYSDVLSFVDPAIDDDTKIRDAFRSYNPVGQQSRMVTLFQGLVAAAGMGPEKQVAPSRRPRTSPQAARAPISSPISKAIANKQPEDRIITPPLQPPPRHTEISEKALEYRLVDLMGEAAGKPIVMSAIIEVITFLKTKDVKEPAKTETEAGGREVRE